MSKLEDLIQQYCPCLTAGRLTEWSIKDFPLTAGKWYIYVLLCDNGMLYKGFSSNPIRRFDEHKRGLGATYTKQHKPLALIYFEEFQTEQEAVEREKKIKSGSGRELLKQTLGKVEKLNIYL